jgi:hypothetical protein
MLLIVMVELLVALVIEPAVDALGAGWHAAGGSAGAECDRRGTVKIRWPQL